MATTTQRLFEAVERGDTAALEALLDEHPADINAIHPFDETRPTLLLRACSRGHTEIVRLLLQRGAHPATADCWGFTPLHKACDRGHAGAVRVLLRHASAASAIFLIAAVDYNQSTPLIWAAWRGHLEVVQELLKYAATATTTITQLHQANGIGNTPLHVACSEGRWQVVRELIRCSQEADLMARNDNHETPLDCALRRSDCAAAVQLLIQAYTKSGGVTLCTILNEAQYCSNKCHEQHSEVVPLDYTVKLSLGMLNAVWMHTLLEAVLEHNPSAIRQNDKLPLRTACQTHAPAPIVDWLLRSYPDALLFL